MMFLTYVCVRYWDKESHLSAGFNGSSNEISSNLFNLGVFSSLSLLEGWFIMWMFSIFETWKTYILENKQLTSVTHIP